MRPADVCGCVRSPICSSSASSLRTVDEETFMPARSTRPLDPTGCPVATYSSTTRTMISRWRSLSSNCMYAGILRQQLGRHAAAEEAPTGRQADRLAADPHRQSQLLEPVEGAIVNSCLEAGESQRLVQPQPEHDPLAPLHVGVERLHLARRLRASAQRLQIGGQPRCVPPATRADRRDCADAEPEVVAAEPVGEIVARPEVPSAGELGTPTEVRRLVPPVSGCRQCLDDLLEVALQRIALTGELIPEGMCEARPGLGLELVAGQVLRLQGERLVQVALQVGGALAGNPIDEIERYVVNFGITKSVHGTPDVGGRRAALEHRQEPR